MERTAARIIVGIFALTFALIATVLTNLMGLGFPTMVSIFILIWWAFAMIVEFHAARETS